MVQNLNTNSVLSQQGRRVECLFFLFLFDFFHLPHVHLYLYFLQFWQETDDGMC